MKSSPSPSRIRHDLDCFDRMGSVLYIGAHPDDENTELLAYLALGRCYRTAYLSLTRGDGGQNVLGPELGPKLGVARTQELLAARRLDGAQQFFSRAVDFGFSKNHSETLKNWDKKEIVADMVRIIRQFRPDVMITRFSPSPGGTHGHHTASAVIAEEAFKLAGDERAFPEQKLAPWQPKRLLWNISRFQKDKAAGIQSFSIDVSGKDPLTGASFVDTAQKSRAMHKTQGFDNFQFHGDKNAPRLESFHVLAGAPASKDIMEGVNAGWSRLSGGAAIDKSIKQVIAGFKNEDPAASVPALLKLHKELAQLPNTDPILGEKKKDLDKILVECLGLKVETTLAHYDVVPGEEMKLHHKATIKSQMPVVWKAIRYPGRASANATTDQVNVALHADKASTVDTVETLPACTPLTQPWWLQLEGTPGRVRVEDPSLIGKAENDPAFPIIEVFEVGGEQLLVPDQPVCLTRNSAGQEIRRRIDVIPPVAMSFPNEVELIGPGASKSVEVELRAFRDDTNGVLSLDVPAGWSLVPAEQDFSLSKAGERKTYKFELTAPEKPESAKIFAEVDMGGKHYYNEHQEINYPHIPPQLLQPPAVLKALCLNLATEGHKVGYLPGAGDSLAKNLEDMGYAVKMLDDANLSAADLVGLDAVVIGVRALNVREKMGTAMPILLDYVKNGGTLIVQYNRPDKLKADPIAPYKLHISAGRVTDETAPVTFLAPDSPILNKPNKLSRADFDAWVQERGIYIPDEWDEHFTPVLSCSDPGEAPLKGSLLVAPYGKGHYIYTGLVFFRQLPAGVPGAYRLFANMVSIGK